MAEGAVPFLTDRDGTGLARMAGELGAAFLEADLAGVEAPAAIVAACVARFGRGDGLVNAAGLTTRGSFVTGTAEVWGPVFDVKARAGFLLMQAVIGDLLARRAAGVVVNILSMNAHCGIPELAIYAAFKGAMATLTRKAAHAHMADRIRVNGINLGWVATETENRVQTGLRPTEPDSAARYGVEECHGGGGGASAGGSRALLTVSGRSLPKCTAMSRRAGGRRDRVGPVLRTGISRCGRVMR